MPCKPRTQGKGKKGKPRKNRVTLREWVLRDDGEWERRERAAEDVPKKTYLRELHEFLLDKEPDFGSEPIEKVQEYLREAGIDPTPTIQSIRKEIRCRPR